MSRIMYANLADEELMQTYNACRQDYKTAVGNLIDFAGYINRQDNYVTSMGVNDVALRILRCKIETYCGCLARDCASHKGARFKVCYGRNRGRKQLLITMVACDYDISPDRTIQDMDYIIHADGMYNAGVHNAIMPCDGISYTIEVAEILSGLRALIGQDSYGYDQEYRVTIVLDLEAIRENAKRAYNATH